MIYEFVQNRFWAFVLKNPSIFRGPLTIFRQLQISHNHPVIPDSKLV